MILAPTISGILTAINQEGCSASDAPTATNTLAYLTGNGLTITDACGTGNLTVTSSDGTPSGSCPWSIIRTYTVTDACGNSSTAQQTITVDDTVAPTITCPATISQTADAGLCTAIVSITPATATDVCSTPTVVGVRSDALALNAPYPVGNTTITWTATDACGNYSNCVQTVTVTDDELPVLAPCPANITVCVGATVNFTAPTATDNCPGVTVTQTGGQPSGITFNSTGITTNTFVATDAASNQSAPCSFTVTVVEDPTLSATGDATICIGGSTLLTATPAGGFTCSPVNWEESVNGVSGWAPISGGTGNTLTVSPSVTTYYRAVYTCTGNGCDPSPLYSGNVLVAVVNPPSISVSGGGSICAGSSAIITASTSGGTGTCGITWESSTNGIDWVVIAGETGAIYTTPALSTGTYYYRATYGCSGSGCAPATAGVTVLVNANPSPDFGMADLSVCANEQGVTYTLSSTYNNYTWAVTGGTIASGGGSVDASVTVNWGAAGNGTVSVTVSDGNTCNGTTTANVTINSRPTVTYCQSPDYCLTSEGGVSFNIQGGLPPYTVSWTPAGGTPSSPATNVPAGIFNINGLQGLVDYTFTITDANGCSPEQ
ncbi:HYR domain-containing protein [Sphingobacteriales bacterium UPWRP_1]|nr:hypothetical protein B6N25_06155 [Sphingobacteriales bacterium TSM_CSS]PSJ78655.1 HYR domain-containing protein [Sphingobacteriales bacterium UPWRP_1]